MTKVPKSLIIMQTKVPPNFVFLMKFNKIMDKLLWVSAGSRRNEPLPSQAALECDTGASWCIKNTVPTPLWSQPTQQCPKKVLGAFQKLAQITTQFKRAVWRWPLSSGVTLMLWERHANWSQGLEVGIGYFISFDR